ncbi:MAG: hypothetical protein ABJ004_09615 [Cyclobacteriaceae bacterium]
MHAQQITGIAFSGLGKTRPDYLLGFVESAVGQPIDTARLQDDCQRLINLEMLSQVTFTIEQDGEVVFHCKELYTLLPILNFGGINDNFWIQVGATEANLWGRGYKVYGYYQHYDCSSFAGNLSFDWINGSPWGVNLGLVKWSTLEPLYFSDGAVSYHYDNRTYGAEGIYHLNYWDKIAVGGSFFTETYRAVSDLVPGAPAFAEKAKFLGKMRFEQNHVNYHNFYLDGWQNTLSLQGVHSFDSDPFFYIIINDFRFFKRISHRGNLAARFKAGLSKNEESPFAPFVLDSYVNIRGVGNRVDRGTGAMVLNLEYRQAVFEGSKVAVQTVVFSDLGTWRNPGGTLQDFTDYDNFQLFVGAGFRFIQKKIFNAIFRLDYGCDVKDVKKNGVVLGLGQYF